MTIVQTIQSVDGEDVVINVEVDSPGEGAGGDFYGATRDAPVQHLTRLQRDVFSDGMALVRYCAARVAETLDKVAEAHPPTEFELQLSIKLDAELGAILAKASAEAQLQVTMRWSRPER